MFARSGSRTIIPLCSRLAPAQATSSHACYRLWADLKPDNQIGLRGGEHLRGFGPSAIPPGSLLASFPGRWGAMNYCFPMGAVPPCGPLRPIPERRRPCPGPFPYRLLGKAFMNTITVYFGGSAHGIADCVCDMLQPEGFRFSSMHAHLRAVTTSSQSGDAPLRPAFRYGKVIVWPSAALFLTIDRPLCRHPVPPPLLPHLAAFSPMCAGCPLRGTRRAPTLTDAVPPFR